MEPEDQLVSSGVLSLGNLPQSSFNVIDNYCLLLRGKLLRRSRWARFREFLKRNQVALAPPFLSMLFLEIIMSDAASHEFKIREDGIIMIHPALFQQPAVVSAKLEINRCYEIIDDLRRLLPP